MIIAKETTELIELFRQFGGKFENAAIGHNMERGFYCHTLDSNQKSIVSCPADLLINITDVGINEEGLYITHPEKYSKNILFLTKYLEFHFNMAMLNQYYEKKKQIDSLSDNELTLITRIYSDSFAAIKSDTTLEFYKKQVFTSHEIDYFGKRMLMPFVTFLNHDSDGTPYDVSKSGISVSGMFNDELLARYAPYVDVFMFSDAYGFIPDPTFIYSLAMSFEFQSIVLSNKTTIRIHRINNQISYTKEGWPMPLVQHDTNTITISWFPICWKGSPLYPARVAKIIESKTGLPAKILLDHVYKYNLNVLHSVESQLKDSKNTFAKDMAKAAKKQLEAIIVGKSSLIQENNVI